jgi:hypothetical protein
VKLAWLSALEETGGGLWLIPEGVGGIRGELGSKAKLKKFGLL